MRSGNGWIGIDIGTWAVRLTQVQRRGGGWHVAAKHLHVWPNPLDAEAICDGDVATLNTNLKSFVDDFRRRRNLFKGRSAAVSLPAELVPLRRMQLPQGPPDQIRAMVTQELLDDGIDSQRVPFGIWSQPADGDDPMVSVTAVVAPEAITNCVVDAMHRCGLDLAVIDVPACCLARATELSREQNQTCGDWIAIDLGNHSTSVILCRDGIPLHARLIRDQGLADCIEPLAGFLGVNCDDAFELLTITGVDNMSKNPTLNPSLASRWVDDVMAAPLASLTDQLKTTIGYFSSKRVSDDPLPIRLCGGGAAIGGLPEWLSQRLGMAVHRWSLPGSISGVGGQNAFSPWAGATALSTLAWTTPCT